MIKVNFKQLELNPFTVLGEEAFLLTAGDMEEWNTMAAAWGGFGFAWDSPTVYVFVRESRLTYNYMESQDKFSMSFFPPELRSVIDYCGSNSGRKVNKAEAAGLTPVVLDGCVAFEESNLVITCEKIVSAQVKREDVGAAELFSKYYSDGDLHHMYCGRVTGIYVQ